VVELVNEFCHDEERSRFDKLKVPSQSRGDAAIHLHFRWIAIILRQGFG